MGGGENPHTRVWTYDGGVPGPELRYRQGARLDISFQNDLPDPTTVHWHGLRLPNAMDGVPGLTQPPVMPGGTFNYAFDLPDAGTYWYHPHVKSAEQIARGLYGPLIIEEADPPKVDRDVTWVIDDWRLNDDAQIAEPFGQMHDLSHNGRLGNVATLNGRDSESFPVRAGERIRLRIINAANARIFRLRFDQHKPSVIALDGHPVRPHQPPGGRIILAPGQRADVIIDMDLAPGAVVDVIDDYFERAPFTYLKLVYAKDQPLRNSPLAASTQLIVNPLPALDLANAARHKLVISGGAMGSMAGATFKGEKTAIRDLVRHHGKAWALNGVAAHAMVMDPLFRFQKGRSQVVAIQNDTAWPHPMHLHGHAFKILERNGKPDPIQPWTDTVLLDPEEITIIAFVADNPGKWLFHCHILEHHQAGMACVVEVV